MGLIEDINKYYQEGKTEGDIVMILQQQGFKMNEINEAIQQAHIKQAVSSDEQPDIQQYQSNSSQDLEQSVMNAEEPSLKPKPIPKQEEPAPAPPQPNVQYEPPEQSYPGADYQPYQQDYQYDSQAYNATPSDTISEIAEQVLTEKLSPLKDKLEIVVDMKNSYDSKISALDERLKRIEKIIDRLQLSVLQKVGEYVNNVEDIKKEMNETQKSFKALLNKSS